MFLCLLHSVHSAWAGVHLAEATGQLGNLVELKNLNQPTPALLADGTPCKSQLNMGFGRGQLGKRNLGVGWVQLTVPSFQSSAQGNEPSGKGDERCQTFYSMRFQFNVNGKNIFIMYRVTNQDVS